MRIIAILLCCVGGCLNTACQFSGGTALPEPSEVRIKTPSGYEFYTNSKVKTKFTVKDGDKEIKFDMTSKPDDVIDAQANLAPALAPLAQIEAERQQAWIGGMLEAFKVGLAAANPLPEVPGPVVP